MKYRTIVAERLAEWRELTNRWEMPSEFNRYKRTIENCSSKEDAFCLGMYTVLDVILPRRGVLQLSNDELVALVEAAQRVADAVVQAEFGRAGLDELYAARSQLVIRLAALRGGVSEGLRLRDEIRGEGEAAVNNSAEVLGALIAGRKRP